MSVVFSCNTVCHITCGYHGLLGCHICGMVCILSLHTRHPPPLPPILPCLVFSTPLRSLLDLYLIPGGDRPPMIDAALSLMRRAGHFVDPLRIFNVSLAGNQQCLPDCTLLPRLAFKQYLQPGCWISAEPSQVLQHSWLLPADYILFCRTCTEGTLSKQWVHYAPAGFCVCLTPWQALRDGCALADALPVIAQLLRDRLHTRLQGRVRDGSHAIVHRFVAVPVPLSTLFSLNHTESAYLFICLLLMLSRILKSYAPVEDLESQPNGLFVSQIVHNLTRAENGKLRASRAELLSRYHILPPTQLGVIQAACSECGRSIDECGPFVALPSLAVICMQV